MAFDVMLLARHGLRRCVLPVHAAADDDDMVSLVRARPESWAIECESPSSGLSVLIAVVNHVNHAAGTWLLVHGHSSCEAAASQSITVEFSVRSQPQQGFSFHRSLPEDSSALGGQPLAGQRV